MSKQMELIIEPNGSDFRIRQVNGDIYILANSTILKTPTYSLNLTNTMVISSGKSLAAYNGDLTWSVTNAQGILGSVQRVVNGEPYSDSSHLFLDSTRSHIIQSPTNTTTSIPTNYSLSYHTTLQVMNNQGNSGLYFRRAETGKSVIQQYYSISDSNIYHSDEFYFQIKCTRDININAGSGKVIFRNKNSLFSLPGVAGDVDQDIIVSDIVSRLTNRVRRYCYVKTASDYNVAINDYINWNDPNSIFSDMSFYPSSTKSILLQPNTVFMFVASLGINGNSSNSFSAFTYTINNATTNVSKQIVAYSNNYTSLERTSASELTMVYQNNTGVNTHTNIKNLSYVVQIKASFTNFIIYEI